jgi:hypothetical protein
VHIYVMTVRMFPKVRPSGQAPQACAQRKRPRPNRPRAFRISGARDQVREPASLAYALVAGEERHGAESRGTGDGSRHPRGTGFTDASRTGCV